MPNSPILDDWMIFERTRKKGTRVKGRIGENWKSETK